MPQQAGIRGKGAKRRVWGSRFAGEATLIVKTLASGSRCGSLWRKPGTFCAAGPHLVDGGVCLLLLAHWLFYAKKE